MHLTESQTACLEQLKSMKDVEGIHFDIPIEVYHHPECPGLSNSDLKMLSKSYNHLLQHKADRALKSGDSEDDPAHFRIGKAVHCALLETSEFAKRYVEMIEEPRVDRRTKEGKLTWSEWQVDVFIPWQDMNRGKTILPREEMQLVIQMSDRAVGHKSLKMLLNGAKFEATIFYRSKQGILLKTRPDLINEKMGVCYDHKTTKDGTRASFSREVHNYRYHKQAAMQIDGIKSVTGKTYDFLIGAHEKPIGELQIFSIDEYNLDVGRVLYNRDLDYLKEVREDKAPKGFSQDIVPLGLPAFAFDIDSQ